MTPRDRAALRDWQRVVAALAQARQQRVDRAVALARHDPWARRALARLHT